MSAKLPPYVFISVTQIRPHCILSYERIEWLIHRSKKARERPNIEQARAMAYAGEMSPGAMKRIKKAVQILIAISPNQRVTHPDTGVEFSFKINFITLTLPAPQLDVTDQELRKHCLEPFIRKLRTHHQMKHYIWKAERQTNGNLHYHITTNVFVEYWRIRQYWNTQLDRFHFIEVFKAKYGHSDPPSTDIHAVRKIKNLAGYLQKYMAKKEEGKAPIGGKVWDCSEALKKAKWLEVESDRFTEWMITTGQKRWPKDYKKADSYEAIFLQEYQIQQLMNTPLKEKYDRWKANIYHSKQS